MSKNVPFMGIIISLIIAEDIFLLIELVILAIATLFHKKIIAYFKYRNARKYHVILGLLNEVEKFNQVIRNIDTLDRLKKAGNQINLSNRTKIVEALGMTREDLFRALKTEKILRDNPDFIPEKFDASNFVTLEALQVSKDSSDYSELFDETLQIWMGINEKMKDFIINR